jgi:hypothetical protein
MTEGAGEDDGEGVGGVVAFLLGRRRRSRGMEGEGGGSVRKSCDVDAGRTRVRASDGMAAGRRGRRLGMRVIQGSDPRRVRAGSYCRERLGAAVSGGDRQRARGQSGDDARVWRSAEASWACAKDLASGICECERG